jgi:hypothetical protein
VSAGPLQQQSAATTSTAAPLTKPEFEGSAGYAMTSWRTGWLLLALVSFCVTYSLLVGGR